MHKQQIHQDSDNLQKKEDFKWYITCAVFLILIMSLVRVGGPERKL